MPFAHHVRVELENGSGAPTVLYYQVDYTLESAVPANSGYLHVSFRRENPTRMGFDLVITEGLDGPGRYLGCSLGIRILDEGIWYGEGEVKVFLDWRHIAPHYLRHLARGLRRERLGYGAPRSPLRRVHP